MKFAKFASRTGKTSGLSISASSGGFHCWSNASGKSNFLDAFSVFCVMSLIRKAGFNVL